MASSNSAEEGHAGAHAQGQSNAAAIEALAAQPARSRAERWASLLEYFLKDGDAQLLAVVIDEIRAEGLLRRASSTADVVTLAVAALSELRQHPERRGRRSAR
jgi:hypothetical protein